MMKTHWSTITPSQYPWERAALDFVRAGLPDHEPYRAWANFEFQSPDGAIYEVDLLVLTKQGFWIVEIKSRPGRVEGDAGTWTWTDKEGKRLSIDNPVLLANRKAKALSSVLKPRMATQKVPTPWLEALVFLSDPGIQCDLQGAARNRVCLVDREAAEDRPARKGILAALISREAPGVEPMARDAIDIKTAKALARALERAGIRPSQKARRVGDYVLGPLLADSPGLCQDRLAEHAALPGVFCRIRQYLVAQAASEDDRQRMKRAAAREFRILQGFDHPGILDARDYKDHEFGPALLFAYEPGAMRLDHFLATRGQALTPTARLEMMRQLADAIRYAHSKKVVHRALGPQSVLIMDPDAEVPRLKVFNWQLGVREAESATTATVHVQDLIDRPALVYMAPEALLDPKAVTEAADVFSLGALAFHLFSGRPPAASPAEMGRTLRENRGLKISAVLDGAGHELEELVRWSTDPDVEMRVQTATDFLEYLDHVEDELTAPAEHHVADPAEARRGDYLEGGYVVERVLGRGATGVALLARQGGAEEFVLKVARDPEANDRLRQEAEALKKVRSEFVVGLHDVREMGGRTVLVLDKAGDETLAERLRKDGPCGLDLLRRFGEDLLQAVASLERHGVAHRDIKPDNIGVRSGKQQLQLVLFDFSLSRVPADQIQVGTRPYLDPFLPLRKPPRWDQEAERYAAGVTLYEMATGVLPRWGDGRSDPALTDAALALEPERIDPAAREGLAGFFAAALARDPARRFHNAEEMLHAWRAVFDEAERRTVTTPAGVEVAVTVDLDAAELDTPVALLGLSPGAADALDRLDVATVRQLIALPVNEVRFRKGVGGATRQEILRVRHQLRQRYPGAKPAGRSPEPASSDGDADPAGLDLDELRRRVLGGESSSRPSKGAPIAATLLGLVGAPGGPPEDWPTLAEVAAWLGLSSDAVGKGLAALRNRWANKVPAITALRNALVAQAQAAGGVLPLAEAIDALLAARKTTLEDPAERRRLATALIRAACETEQAMATPRLHPRRAGRGMLLALTPELGDYAERLGRAADEIAAEDPLPSSLRVFQRLYEVPQPDIPPDCPPPNNDRLLRLAAAASTTAAVSIRQELYPRRMKAERALCLGLGALSALGLGDPDRRGDLITIDQIRTRIAARYPEADPLPDRPELDRLIGVVGLDFAWDEDAGAYRRPSAAGPVSSGSCGAQPLPTASPSKRAPVTPWIAQARQFDERLDYALRDGSFLVLTIRPGLMRACEQELRRRHPVLRRVSLDHLLLEHLRRESDRWEVDWQVIREADGAPRGSEDWQNLLDLVARVIPAIEAELLGSREPILLVYPGLLARYDQVGLLERLRDRVGRRETCPGLWVLVACDEQSELPLIDGREVPLLTPGQRARVPLAWLENAHRAAATITS